MDLMLAAFAPADDLLSAYAAGGLDRATALVASAYADMNPCAATRLRMLEAAGGALLETGAPAAMMDGALEAVFARIDAVPAARPAVVAPRRASAVMTELAFAPVPVRLALEQARPQAWAYRGPGVRAATLLRDGEAEVQVLRIEPGHGAPRHSHGGAEITLCLKGAFADESGRFGPGDLCFAGPDVTHRPVALPEGTCYALAVSDAPLRFTGALGLMQRIFSGD